MPDRPMTVAPLDVMLPATTRRRAADAAAIAADVLHAWEIFTSYTASLPGGAARLAGANVLEIGPGGSLGAAALIAAHGARVSVADPYLGGWDADYHVAFFTALQQSLDARADAIADRCAIGRLLEAGRFVDETVTIFPLPVESLKCPDASFDLILSCAVLEHVRDVPAALGQLARLTRRGGLSVHVVDFRDHRDFARPLEYLTLDTEFFWSMFDARWGECGNRWRHSYMALVFQAAGFHAAFEPLAQASPEYLRDVRRRLHADFRGLETAALSTLIGQFVCVRGSVPARSDVAAAPVWLPPAGPAPTPQRVRAYQRIVIYGAGRGAFAAITLLERLGLADRIVAICDSDPAKHSTTICGLSPGPFTRLDAADYDLVVVASGPGRAAISMQLLAAGLQETSDFEALGFVTAFAHAAVAEAAA